MRLTLIEAVIGLTIVSAATMGIMQFYRTAATRADAREAQAPRLVGTPILRASHVVIPPDPEYVRPRIASPTAPVRVTSRKADVIEGQVDGADTFGAPGTSITLPTPHPSVSSTNLTLAPPVRKAEAAAGGTSTLPATTRQASGIVATPFRLWVVQGKPYAGLVASVSGGKAPISYKLATGTLPPGMSMESDGTLVGTPTVPGSYDVGVMARDSTGQEAVVTTTLNVSNR